MPVVPICLDIDEKTLDGINKGLLELCGLVKNADNKRVVKHIPAVADAAKENASKAVDFIRENKKGTFFVGAIIIVTGVVAAAIGCASTIKRQKLNKQFGKSLQEYLDSARSGTLNIDTLNNLICSIEAIEKVNARGCTDFNISTSQFCELLNCLYDYTKNLAEANNISIQTIECPTVSSEKAADNLKYYLNIQKHIFEQAA